MSATSAIPPTLRPRLESELQPGESLLWAGQPAAAQGVRAAFALYAFFLPWTLMAAGFVAASAYEAVRNGLWLGIGMMAISGFLLLIGVGGLSNPFLTRRRNRRTIYVLTDRRALILEAVRGGMTLSVPLSELGHLERSQRADGSGDLVIKIEPYRDEGSLCFRKHAFERVRDVREVARLLEAAREAART